MFYNFQCVSLILLVLNFFLLIIFLGYFKWNIFVLISFLYFSLTVYRNIIDFYILILYSATLKNILNSFKRFIVDSSIVRPKISSAAFDIFEPQDPKYITTSSPTLTRYAPHPVGWVPHLAGSPINWTRSTPPSPQPNVFHLPASS